MACGRVMDAVGWWWGGGVVLRGDDGMSFRLRWRTERLWAGGGTDEETDAELTG